MDLTVECPGVMQDCHDTEATLKKNPFKQMIWLCYLANYHTKLLSSQMHILLSDQFVTLF